MNKQYSSKYKKCKRRKTKISGKTKMTMWVLVISSISIVLLYGFISKDKFADQYQDNVLGKTPNKQAKSITDEQQVNEDIKSYTADKSNWKLLLVNSDHQLPDDFSVELTKLKDGQSIDKRAYKDLQAMIKKMHSAGLYPRICSSYRTQQKQEYLFNNEVKECIANGTSRKNAKEEAAKWVAVPGTSEHQTGLALDIVATSYQILDKKQETTAEQKWLIKNSYKYGFILRYPSDKSEITGIGYEPWHYRYVGKEAAKEIYDKGVCLEEYLEEIDSSK